MAEDLSIAVGLRPPVEYFPLLWHSLTDLIASGFGIGGALLILKILGPVFLFLSGVLVARIIYLLLPSETVAFLRRFQRGKIFLWSILFLGGALFSLSEVVWQMGLNFSPDIFRVFLFLAAIVLLHKAATSFKIAYLAAAGFVSALVAAESMLGFLSLVFLPIFFYTLQKNENPDEENSADDFLDRAFAPRRFATFFAFFYFAAVALNICFFNAHSPEGYLSDGAFFGLFNYFSGYLAALISSITFKKIVIVFSFVFAPLGISVYLSRKICRLDVVSRVFHIFAAFAIFVLMSAESFDFPTAWFWAWLDGTMADSTGFILALCILLTAISAMLTFFSLGVDVLFRNYRSIGMLAVKEAAIGEVCAIVPAATPFLRRFVQVIYCLLFPLMLFLLVYSKFGSVHAQAQAIVDDAVKLIVDECGSRKYIFTDGNLDAEIETESLSRGGDLKAISMMSSGGVRDANLRIRGESDLERIATLETGAAEALRHWVRSNDSVLTDVAVQVGFELWVHDKRPLPQIGGLSAVISPWDEDKLGEFVDRARAIADRILALTASRHKISHLRPRLYSQLSVIQFRLARMASMRAMKYYAEGKKDLAHAERIFAEKLDDANPEVRRIRMMMDIYERQKGLKLTPQEGLKIGLIIKDLNFSRFYAKKVIKFNPENLEANYILGVALIAENDLAGAEYHLRICEKRSPNNPSVLSNLAVVLLRLGRLDEAERLAVRAEELAPNVSEIANTLRDVRKAKENGIMSGAEEKRRNENER